MPTSLKTTVLIIGAGPTGLMMACQLAIHHIPFIIVEKEKGPTTESRALGIQARSLEIFDQMGISDKFTKEGKPASGLNFVANGKQVQHVPLTGLGTGLTKFPYLLILEQARTEAFLLDFLEKRGHAISWNTTVQTFTQTPTSVTAVIQNEKGNDKQIESDWIIGADGAHSIVRHILKIPLEGKTYSQSLFVLDCKIQSHLSAHDITVATSDSSFGAFFPMTNDRWRIVAEAPKHASEKNAITFEDVEKDLAKSLKIPLTLSNPTWISLYKAHHRCVSHFRDNRAFLLGDAANIHSPIGAQGMNTGLQDAYNLAWKIAFVHQKKANPAILDTYNTERLPFAKKLVETTDRLFNLFVSDSVFFITLRDRILPRIIKGVISHKRIGHIAFRNVSQIAISYHTSMLSQGSPEGFEKNAPRPGDRLPYVLYGEDEKNIQDSITPQNFHLLLFSQDTSFIEEIKQTVEKYKESISITELPLTDKTRKLYKKLGIKKSAYYLVRPDLYIAYKSANPNLTPFKHYLTHILEA